MPYKLIFLTYLLISCPAAAEKINYVGMAITDDEIADAIKPPRPLSVSRVIKATKAKYKNEEIEMLDFSDNNITLQGAIKLLEFANELPYLKKLIFYQNRIYDWRGNKGYDEFETLLIKLLEKKNFKKLDLRLNGIANSSWYKSIRSKDHDNAKKIKWKS